MTRGRHAYEFQDAHARLLTCLHASCAQGFAVRLSQISLSTRHTSTRAHAKMSDSRQRARCADARASMHVAASGPLRTGARARTRRECMSMPESANIARPRAFAADISAVRIACRVRRNEIASEKAVEMHADCKLISVAPPGFSLQPGRQRVSRPCAAVSPTGVGTYLNV